MDQESIDEEFNQITETLTDIDLAVPESDQPGIEITISYSDVNGTIWRLNEASMYLSRFLQYTLLDDNSEVPEEVFNLLEALGVLSRQVSLLLEDNEIDFDCLECLEKDENHHEENLEE